MERIPLVLLSGTLCDALLWEYQLTHLADIASMQVGDLTQSDMLSGVARDVLAAAPEKFALAGLSYGGIVAFEIMRQAPERVLKLALLNTTPKAVSLEKKEAQQRFVGMAHTGEFREITTDYLKDAMLDPQHQKDMVLRAKILQMAENIGIEGFINQIKAQLQRPDSTPDLEQIACPTLLLTGRMDQLCTVALHEEMAAKIPFSRLVIVENCGHLSTMEQPEIVTQAMHEWLMT